MVFQEGAIPVGGYRAVYGIEQSKYSRVGVGICSQKILRIHSMLIIIYSNYYVWKAGCWLAWISAWRTPAQWRSSPVEMSRMPCYLRQGTSDFRNGCSVGQYQIMHTEYSVWNKIKNIIDEPDDSIQTVQWESIRQLHIHPTWLNAESSLDCGSGKGTLLCPYGRNINGFDSADIMVRLGDNIHSPPSTKEEIEPPDLVGPVHPAGHETWFFVFLLIL